MNIVDYIDTAEAIKVFMFGFAALLGMLYAYVNKWSSSKDYSVTLGMYLFGDKKAVVKALTTLGVLCVGAGGLDYLDTLTGFNIFVAGASIGFLVPKTVDDKVSAASDAKNGEKKEFTLKAPPRKTEQSDS